MIILNEILFLLFAFFTVFLSVKLSYYTDALSKSSKISGALIGGIVLAGITSLPELVTCFSSIAVSNNDLAVGDILGSNIFNIFMICAFDLVFIKKMIFTKTNKSHNLVFIILSISYFVLYFFVSGFFRLSIAYIGLPTFVILAAYFYYLFKISKKEDDKIFINSYKDNDLIFKLVITSIFMVFSSIVLTILVNNIAADHPLFSSSFLGAIFLGVTTSLPEVVTCYTLLNMDSYDLALSDIIGSNLFNLFILSVGDLSIRTSSIYSFTDDGEILLIILGFIFTLLLFLTNKLKIKKIYGLISVLIVIIYLGYWILNFVY